MQVTQAYFTDNDNPPPQPILDCMATVERYINSLPHVIYDLSGARAFIIKHFGNEVLDAFDKLNPYAYKADLFRYCALFAIGGWYFDSTVRINTSVIIPDYCNSIAFRDVPIVTNSAWSVWNGALFSKPGNQVYELAINLIIENCNNNYYGSCNLCPTGPLLLGRAFATVGDDIGNLFFNVVNLTPGYKTKNPALVLSDGVIFAFLKQAGLAGLGSYGVSGGNIYSDFYNFGNVYKEKN